MISFGCTSTQHWHGNPYLSGVLRYAMHAIEAFQIRNSICSDRGNPGQNFNRECFVEAYMGFYIGISEKLFSRAYDAKTISLRVIETFDFD